jgi:hypothetical protein
VKLAGVTERIGNPPPTNVADLAEGRTAATR